MLDFDVKRCTRKCAATDRELRAGELVYSTLVAEGGEVRRVDYAAEAWDGPPEGTLGWWKFEIPDLQAGKLQWAPSDVIRKYFKELTERDEEADKRYVLALLMIRRRMMRLDETEKNAEGQESLVLYCAKEETEYTVPVTEPTADRVRVIQDQLAELLFAGAGTESPSEDDSEPAAAKSDPPDETDETKADASET